MLAVEGNYLVKLLVQYEINVLIKIKQFQWLEDWLEVSENR